MKTLLNGLFSRFNLTPFFETPGGGSGSGTGAPGQGQPSGGSQGQQGQPGGGSGGGSAVRFDPNATYDFGDGKPVKGSEYLAGFMPRSQFEQGRDFLLKEADRLEKLYGRLIPQQRQPQQQQQQQRQRTNPMERFENAPVVDGRMLSEAYKAMSEGDIAPMTQALTHLAQFVKKQQETITSLQKGYGTINEQTRTQDFGRRMSSSVESLGVDPALMKEHGGLLNELAQDVYLSHDPNDPNLDKEFGALLKSRFDSMIKLVRAMDKMNVEKARTMKRTFTRPGGNAQPGQPSRYQHENGAQLGRRLFGEAAGGQ